MIPVASRRAIKVLIAVLASASITAHPVASATPAGCTTGAAFQNPIFCVVPVPILVPVVVLNTRLIAFAYVCVPVYVVAAILVTVKVSVANVKSASSVSLPFVVAKGTRPDVRAISFSVNSLTDVLVVIVP